MTVQKRFVVVRDDEAILDSIHMLISDQFPDADIITFREEFSFTNSLHSLSNITAFLLGIWTPYTHRSLTESILESIPEDYERTGGIRGSAYRMLQRIRSQRHLAQTPVIILENFAMSEPGFEIRGDEWTHELNYRFNDLVPLIERCLAPKENQLTTPT
jgi:hypothetical protein